MHPAQPPQKKEPGIAAFTVGQSRGETMLQHDLSPGISRELQAQPVRMDRKAHARLRRGRLKPEARLDLHGMTLAQAHPRLNSFVLDSYARGRRLVLVITGKGKDRDHGGPIPVRRGVLKHQVPHWLTTPPLAHVVLQIAEAHLKHGGAGAYYVYLRRNR